MDTTSKAVTHGLRRTRARRTRSLRAGGVGEPGTHARSFSHFIERLKLAAPLQRAFYEVQAVTSYWSVRKLKRALDSPLHKLQKRTGLATHKAPVLAKYAGSQSCTVADMVRNPYVLQFLGLEERPGYRRVI